MTLYEPVFLDACVFFAAGFNVSSRDFRILDRLAENHTLLLLTTDIIVREVHANIEKELATARERHDALRKCAVLRASETGRSLLLDLPVERIRAEVSTALEAFLTRTKCEILTTGSISPASIFDDYFDRRPPFDNPRKPKEFPDAFSVAALSAWCAVEGRQVTVVTEDESFGAAAKRIEGVTHVTALKAVFDEIYSRDEPRAHFVKSEVLRRREELEKWAGQLFEGLSFDVANRLEGEVLGISVSQVRVSDDPDDFDLIEVEGSSATLVTNVEVSFTALIRYGNENDAAWDGEFGMSYWSTIDEANDEKRTMELEIHASVGGLDPDRFAIEKIDLADRQPIELLTNEDRQALRAWK